MKKRGKTNKRQWGVVVEVVGWGKNKQRTPSTWSDAVCRRVQFPTPFWRVTYSFSIFVRLCSGAPSARPNCLLLLQEEEEEISFLFYFLPSSQSDRVQSCSRRIVVFNKSYSSFLISSPLLFEQKCYGYCSRRHKKTKKKKFLAQTIFPTVSCACARVKQCVRSFVSDWKKKKNWRKLWVVLWVSYHIHIDRWIDIHLFCVSQWLQSKKKSTKKKKKKKRVSNVFP